MVWQCLVVIWTCSEVMHKDNRSMNMIAFQEKIMMIPLTLSLFVMNMLVEVQGNPSFDMQWWCRPRVVLFVVEGNAACCIMLQGLSIGISLEKWPCYVKPMSSPSQAHVSPNELQGTAKNAKATSGHRPVRGTRGMDLWKQIACIQVLEFELDEIDSWVLATYPANRLQECP